MYDQTYPIFVEDLPFKKYLTYSVFLHLGLTAFMLISIWIQRSGENWGGIGGGGDAVSVNLVANSGIPMPQPDNAVNYGKGGNPSLPSGFSNTPTPGPMSGGVQARGEGGGNFAGRYPWYVQAMTRQISQNWFQNTIDASARNSAHATATFTINRDGSVKNIRISQSSGNASYDNSALRALFSIDHFPPLPPDYSGSYVNVDFDFLPPGSPTPR